MSNILRRPMFRGGGKVSSYGNGIASGLGYAGGGQIGGGIIYGNPMPDGRYGFSTPRLGLGANMAAILADQANATGSNVRTGGSLLSKARSSFPLIGRLIGPGTIYAGQTVGAPLVGGLTLGTGLGALTNYVVQSTDTPVAYQTRKDIMEEDPFAYSETDMDVGEKMLRVEEAQLVGEAPGLFPRGGRETFYRDKGLDPKTGQPLAYEQEKEKFKARLASKKEIEDLTTTVDTDINGNIEQKPGLEDIQFELEKDKKLFKELLGADKARSRDIGDMLASASASFLGTGQVKEGFAEFMANQAKSGPSRIEKINQTAAGLAINDYIAGRRSKESLDELLAKTKFGVDYQAEVAGRATAVLGGENPEDWLRDLRNVASRTRDKQITDADVIRTTLFERYKTPVNVKSFPKKTIESIVNQNAGDLSVGYNIVISKDGKYIIEKKQNGESSIKINLPIT
jgi:hypothetical protein